MSTMTSSAIVCPTWCTIHREQHLEELGDPTTEGVCRHESAEGGYFSVVQMSYADGSVHLPARLLDHSGDVVTSEQVQQVRAALRLWDAEAQR